MKLHSDALDKIHAAIYQDIELIIQQQSDHDGELTQAQSDRLLEYGKYLRSEKPYLEKDLHKMSDEDLEKEIDRVAKQFKNKIKSRDGIIKH